jgi:NTP pyrophosphatase (non-canonical NTP hydrolase)
VHDLRHSDLNNVEGTLYEYVQSIAGTRKSGGYMSEHFNNLTPAEHERLSILFEEAGEVIQVVGKIMRHGFESCHPDGGPTNRELLEKELGDFKLAEIMMAHAGDVCKEEIGKACNQKNHRIGAYLHHQP